MVKNNNVAVVCSYHDLSRLNFMNIQKNLKISDRLFLINNKFCSSPTLKKLYEKYGFYNGVQFDEFNAQSYYSDVMNDDAEYVYNCQYRRCLTLPSPFNLTPSSIYCSRSDKGFNIQVVLREWITSFDKENYVDVLKEIKFIFSKIFGLVYETVDEYFKLHAMYGHQLYILPKELHTELVQLGYKLIEEVCENIDDKYLNKTDFMDVILESFVSFFLILKKKNGYNITTCDIKLI